MKLVDIGRKPEEETAVPVEGKKGNPEKYYPELSLNDNVPEDLASLEVGAMVRLEVVAKIRSKTTNEGEDGKKNNLSIEVQKIGYIGKAGKMTKDEYLNASQDERDKNDIENAETKDENDDDDDA